MQTLRRLTLLFLLVWPLAAQQTIDNSGAQKTIPYKMAQYEPGACVIGEVYLNTTTGKVR